MIYRGLTHEFDFCLPSYLSCSPALIGSMTILHVKPDFQILHGFLLGYPYLWLEMGTCKITTYLQFTFLALQECVMLI